METLKLVLLFSGKRKAGKDYICENLKLILGDDCCSIIRISEPLKKLYAQNHNLDLKELMSDGPYKEQHRLNMINWSDKIRKETPGCFCKSACENAPAKSVWIISDIRRKTDIEWFRNMYKNKIRTIRVKAEMNTRVLRGWVFTSGVDDAESECNLDDITNWDLEINNNNTTQLEEGLKTINDLIKSII